MTWLTLTHLIWVAGGIHLGIVLANIPLPKRLRVSEGLASVPRFLRQIFYVHWLYIVIIVGLFGVLCFGFSSDLAGANPLGRFFSGFMAGFWLLRIVLQWFYYDAELRRTNRALDFVYTVALVALVAIFGFVAVHPRG